MIKREIIINVIQHFSISLFASIFYKMVPNLHDNRYFMSITKYDILNYAFDFV